MTVANNGLHYSVCTVVGVFLVICEWISEFSLELLSEVLLVVLVA